MTYAQKLKDPRWQKLRLEVFQRDDWLCRECFLPGRTLTVHHQFYFLRYKNPWEYPLKALVTLCEGCHDKRRKAIEELFNALLTASTGEILIWALRIKKERPNLQRKLTRQANITKLQPPHQAPIQFPTNGKTVWEQMRDAANGIIALKEVHNAK